MTRSSGRGGVPALTPILDERAALVTTDPPTLVVAELHIGLEASLARGGAYVGPGTRELAEHLGRLAVAHGCGRVLVAGDFKESVPLATMQERREIPLFVEALAVSARERGGKPPRLEIVLGNHDGGLRDLVPAGVALHPPGGIVLDAGSAAVGVFHGHAWPAEATARCEELLAAHTHPAVALVDELGHAHVEPCWVRGPVSREARQRYADAPPRQRITVIPPFNPLLGGACVNVDGLLGPGGKMVDLARADLFLLDGTHLGRLRHLPRPPEDWLRRRKPPKGEEL